MGAMGASLGIQAAGSLANGYVQSESMRMQGRFQQQQAEMNERMAEIQAKDAIRRGDKEAQKLKGASKRMIGSQRAAMAAQGIDVEDGSALEIQQDTAEMAAMDAQTIKNNAWREAWGFKVQASNYSMQGQFAASSSKFNADSTMLASGIKAIDYGTQSYARYKG